VSNRILRQSICRSDTIEKLSPSAEVFFYRLIVNADDYGLLSAKPELLKADLYPLKEIKLMEIVGLLADVETAGLIRTYEVADKQYLAIMQWDQHQRIRAKRSHLPQPAGGLTNLRGAHPPSNDSTRGHLPLARTRDAPAESESESESESKIKSVVDKTTTPTPPRKDERGTRLPKPWELPDDWKTWAVDTFHMDPKKVVRISIDFRDYWWAKPGLLGRKSDWEATWRRWITKEADK
jgi:hypothetical protein